MAVVISLSDPLSTQLENRATAEHTTTEALAVRILSDALSGSADWQVCNQRRVELIRKRFSSGLTDAEKTELEQLQTRADQRVEELDGKMLADAQAIYESAWQLLEADGS